MTLDHVFLFVEAGDAAPGGALRARLDALGLAPSYSRRHHGQGTENLAYAFDNAYLELLFVADASELAAPAVARTGLGARARWRETGASPVGIGLRGGGPPPFPASAYRFDALPPGMHIPIALDSADIRQPFMFVSPGTAPPIRWTDGRAGARQTAAGFERIADVEITLPRTVRPAPAVEALGAAGVILLRPGAGHGLALTLSRQDGGEHRLVLADPGAPG